MPANPTAVETRSINDVVFNLSDYLIRENRKDDTTLRGMSPSADRALATRRYHDSQEARTALAENQLDSPVIGRVLFERLTEFHQELQKTWASLESLSGDQAAYQQASEQYQRQLKYYTGLNENYAEFLQRTTKAQPSANPQVPAPAAVPERQQQKQVVLEFPPGEQLLPAGNEQGAWASGNARFVEKAILRSFVAMGVNLPFSPDDIYSGMSRDLINHPPPSDCKLVNGQAPILWLEYGLDENNGRGFVRVPHAVNSHDELVQILKSFSQVSEKPMTRIAINIRKDVAVQLTAENLSQHPGVLIAIAHELARVCLPPEEVKKVAGARFAI